MTTICPTSKHGFEAIVILANLKQKTKIIGSLSESDPFFDATETLRKRAKSHSVLPGGVVDAVIEALFYAAIRHRPFVQTPLFGAVLGSYLSRHFGLPMSLTSLLVEDLMVFTGNGESSPAYLVPPNDREFLRYLVAHVTSSHDLETLVRDFGLGSEILCKLSNSIQYLEYDDGEDASSLPVFLPELDAHISQIVYDLALDQGDNPWAVNHWLLRFRLMEVPEPWRQRLKETGESWLLEVLVQIGIKRQASLKSIQNTLNSAWGSGRAPLELSWLLRTFDLAYPIAPSTQQSLWELSGYGRTLTSDVAASQLLREKGSSPLGDYIGTLYPEYQVALIRQYPFATSDELVCLAMRCRPLAPAALDIALGRLAHMAGPQKAQQVAQEILQHDSSTWLRKTASKRRFMGSEAQKLTEA